MNRKRALTAIGMLVMVMISVGCVTPQPPATPTATPAKTQATTEESLQATLGTPAASPTAVSTASPTATTTPVTAENHAGGNQNCSECHVF